MREFIRKIWSLRMRDLGIPLMVSEENDEDVALIQPQSNLPEDYFIRLPRHVLTEIFKRLPLQDILTIRQLCRATRYTYNDAFRRMYVLQRNTRTRLLAAQYQHDMQQFPLSEDYTAQMQAVFMHCVTVLNSDVSSMRKLQAIKLVYRHLMRCRSLDVDENSPDNWAAECNRLMNDYKIADRPIGEVVRIMTGIMSIHGLHDYDHRRIRYRTTLKVVEGYLGVARGHDTRAVVEVGQSNAQEVENCYGLRKLRRRLVIAGIAGLILGYGISFAQQLLFNSGLPDDEALRFLTELGYGTLGGMSLLVWQAGGACLLTQFVVPVEQYNDGITRQRNNFRSFSAANTYEDETLARLDVVPQPIEAPAENFLYRTYNRFSGWFFTPAQHPAALQEPDIENQLEPAGP